MMARIAARHDSGGANDSETDHVACTPRDHRDCVSRQKANEIHLILVRAKSGGGAGTAAATGCLAVVCDGSIIDAS